VTLPTYRDYAEAIQNPHVSFKDQRLAVGQAALTKLGTPQASTGGFAIAFQLKSGGRAWAVRCFTHDSADLAGRYQAISSFLGSAPRTGFVPVEYLEQGVRVAGQWWPVTVMPWVQGTALNEWVQGHLGASAALISLRTRFAALVEQLEQSAVAHGDLQHGNVVIGPSGDLTLIDYDGMYVPALSGTKMPEGGQPNYQHPDRSKAAFGPGLDRFSAAVIWSALEVLSEDSRFWAKYDNGENLLFRADDFARPSDSAILADLRAHHSLAHVAERITRLAQAPVDRLPTLADVVAGRLPTVTRRPSTPLDPGISILPYQVVDLRRGDPAAFEGERLYLVGEVLGLIKGTTKYGDPYVFVRLGARGHEWMKIVVWSNVLYPLGWGAKGPLPKVGDVVGVTGFLTRFRGELQIELERPALFEALRDDEVQRATGSRWASAPPSSLRLTHPRVGDLVRHQVFGLGSVTGVKHDAVTIDFQKAGAKSIQYTKFYLELVQPAQRSGPGHGTGANVHTPPKVTPPPATPSKPTPPIGPASPGSADLGRTDADALNRLYGSTTGSSAPGLPGGSTPTPIRTSGAPKAAPQSPPAAPRDARPYLAAGALAALVAALAANLVAGPEAGVAAGAAAAIGSAAIAWSKIRSS
jgi:hypothetical protein